MHQLILDLLPETPPSLDNFVVGSNGEALAGLAGWLAADSRETLLLLWGEPASGKTHLLRASGARYIDAQDDCALAGLEAATAEDTMATTVTPESIPGIPTRASPVRYAIDNIETLDERGQIALFDFIADSDGNAVHFTGDFRWYFHGGFVGFQYQHGLADFDGITGFDQYFDDINGVKIANVGDANFIAHFNILFLFWN